MTEGEITKAVLVDAPPGVVFKALTDEKELVRWMPHEARSKNRSEDGVRVAARIFIGDLYNWSRRLDPMNSLCIVDDLPFRVGVR